MNELTGIYPLFLEILSCAVQGKIAAGTELLDFQTWNALIEMAKAHSVLPLIMEAVYQNFQDNKKNEEGKAYGGVPAKKPQRDVQVKDQLITDAKKKARATVIRQARKTAEFLLFYEYLADKNLHPLVMKGAVCRNLYPEPEQRPSVDEDLLIKPEEFVRYNEAITAYGLTPEDPAQDIDAAYEVSYKNEEKHLYVEVHKYPFAPESGAYGDLNRFFEKTQDHFVLETIHGTGVQTLTYTDHLLYLILHVYKHFLYSGFGIRQICDIILFSNRYFKQIDWSLVETDLKACRAYDFARAVFRIGERWLYPESPLYGCIRQWKTEEIDEGPLLKDVLRSGLYGGTTRSRLHSSSMTLYAVTVNRKSGKRCTSRARSNTSALLHAVFQSRKSLEDRYTYLRKAPFLLPAAWVQRIAFYFLEMIKPSSSDKFMDAARIGKERIRLLKMYNIIDS